MTKEELTEIVKLADKTAIDSELENVATYIATGIKNSAKSELYLLYKVLSVKRKIILTTNASICIADAYAAA